MQSKNKKSMTKSEREHVGRVKALPCSVCDAPPVSEAHEPVQGAWWIAIALCRSCHSNLRGPMWLIKKLDEWGALNITIRRLMTGT